MNNIDLQQFFLQRMVEMFNKNSIDSYRVRSNNVITLALELRDVIDGWKNNTIKRGETVKLSIEETTAAINADSCINFDNCPKEILLGELDSYSKNHTDENAKGARNPSEADHLIFYLDYFISSNKQSYLDAILCKLSLQLLQNRDFSDDQFIPVVEEIDRLSSSFGCELLRIGFSKVFLYEYFTILLKNTNSIPFANQFDGIRNKFGNPVKSKFTTIFTIGFLSAKSFDKENIVFPEFVDSVPQEYIDTVSKEKRKKLTSPSYKYYISDVDEFDYVSAIKSSREKLSSILDTKQLGANNISINIPYTALAFYHHEGRLTYKSHTAYSIDSNSFNDAKDSQGLALALQRIDSNKQYIEKPCQDRIISALRHLRIGDSQSEIEQKFINYWIGLEFIFSSPATTDSTFPRLKENLITVLSCCYIRRNIENLNNFLIARKHIPEGECYWEKEDLDTFINDLSDILVKYRLKKIKSHLHHHDKRKSYIDNHRKNLQQHLSRLYRLRNELIHEAAIKQNIENITSNLRYYLVFVLNQAIDFFANTNPNRSNLNMDSFFWHYEYLWKRIVNSKYDFKELMSVPFESTLIK